MNVCLYIYIYAYIYIYIYIYITLKSYDKNECYILIT